MKWILILLGFTSEGSQQDSVVGISSLSECQQMAREYTGSKSGTYVFTSKDGRFTAICKKGDLSAKR